MYRNLFLFILCCLFFSMQVDSSPCREAVNGKRRVFLPFEQAMDKVRSAGVSSKSEYEAWRKDHPDMPSNPFRSYRDQWQGWGHFLGTGRLKHGDEHFLPFEQAMEKMRGAGVSSSTEYFVWQKDYPEMPFNPHRFYREWQSWGHFLGTERVRGRDFLSFEQAMENVQSAGVSSASEYTAWRKDYPEMPSNPDVVYRDQWQGWGHFLGTERVRVKKLFLPYNKAVLKARRAGVSSSTEYFVWQKDYPEMPYTPDRVYREWQSWGHFLGTGNVWSGEFLSFEQAMEKVRGAGVLSERKYWDWQKDYPEMPYEPYQVYRDQWQGWGHFLGTL